MFRRSINRMIASIAGTRARGELRMAGRDVYAAGVDVVELRRRVGMVFQKSNPFPKSIYENIAYGLRIGGIRDRRIIDETVERSLQRAALWDEAKDRLNASALARSEEHTSELQSLMRISYAVFCLKKKKNNT